MKYIFDRQNSCNKEKARKKQEDKENQIIDTTAERKNPEEDRTRNRNTDEKDEYNSANHEIRPVAKFVNHRYIAFFLDKEW